MIAPTGQPSLAGSHEACMRRLYPTSDDLPATQVYTDLKLPAGPVGRPLVVLNMVSTVDGKVALRGSAAGIGSRTDRLLMRQLRAAADGLMIAAGTLRAEMVDPRVPAELAERRVGTGRPAQPLAIAVSGSLDLDPDNPFFSSGPDGTLVLTTETAPRERERALRDHARVLRVGARAVDLAAALHLLRADFALERLLVEGGPSLNQALLDLDFVDEVFWTIAPKLAGGRGPTLIQGRAASSGIAARLVLLSLYEHAGELFARYRAVRDPSA